MCIEESDPSISHKRIGSDGRGFGWSLCLFYEVTEKLSEKPCILDFPHHTRRELFQHRKLLQRAIAWGRNVKASKELEIKIDEELIARRNLRFADATKDVPEIY